MGAKMNSDFKKLQARHEELLHEQEIVERLDSAKQKETLEILLNLVKAYIDEIREESAKIVAPQERDQLRAILRYWSGFVYKHTETYPETDLRPAEGNYHQNQLALIALIKERPILILIVIGVFVTILFLVWRLDLLGVYGAIAPTSTATPTYTPTLPHIISVTSTFTPTSIPSTTPSSTPKLTPTPTYTPSPSLTPTQDLSSISVLLQEPQNGSEVLPRARLSGTFSNLRPGWSIHAVLQPISQGGLLFPAADFFMVPSNQVSGNWQFEVLFGSSFELQTSERYIIQMIVATSDAGRNYLANAVTTGIEEIPSEFISFPQLTTVNRSAYDEINEVRIVFYSASQANTYDIFTMKLDGTDIRQLTNTPNISEIAPSLSPTGDRIAYLQLASGETTDEIRYSLWVMDSSGQNPTMLVDNLDINIYPQPVPVWSPDSKYIAYNTQVPNQSNVWLYQIFLYNVETGVSTQFTDDILSSTYPSWMPDSETVIFRNRVGIWSKNIRTGETTKVFDDRASVETHLAVSPDGNNVAFTYFTDTSASGNRDIYSLDLTTDGLQQITSHSGLDWMPRWHPDGNSIYFESHRDTGIPSIWMANADGSGERQISSSNKAEYSPFVGLMRAYLPREP